MRVLVQLLLVAIVLLAGVKGAAVLGQRPDAGERPAEAIAPPLVETVRAVAQEYVPLIQGTGEARPRQRAWVVPEVAGVVQWVSPEFVPGAILEQGAPLLRLDATDLELEVEGRKADLARASARLAQEEALAAQAAEEQRILGVAEPSPLALRQPQLQESRAAQEAALVGLRRAEEDLTRLEVVVPFQATVLSVDVGVGQLVQRGNRLGELGEVAMAEVSVPLRDRDVVHLPFDLRQGLTPLAPLACEVVTSIGGRRMAIPASVHRIDGALDPRSRMVKVILQVPDPYGLLDQDRLPLFSGSHVEAEIQGTPLEGAMLVPRTAVFPGDTVWVVVEEGRLAKRSIQVAWRTRDEVVATGGLVEGDRIVVSPLTNPVEGMVVRLLPGELEASRE